MGKDFHSRLTVYGLSKMDKRTVKNLVKWLRKQADDIEKSPKDYSDNYVARLMK